MSVTPGQRRYSRRKQMKEGGFQGAYNRDHVMGDETQRLSLEALSSKQHRKWLSTLSMVCDLMRWKSLTLEEASAVVYGEIDLRHGRRRGLRFRK